MVLLTIINEKANVRLLQDSLRDKDDTSLAVDGRFIGLSISSSLAQAIHDKLLSGIKWKKVLIEGCDDRLSFSPLSSSPGVVKMVRCYPEDDEALHILQSAFRQVEMKKLVFSHNLSNNHGY